MSITCVNLNADPIDHTQEVREHMAKLRDDVDKNGPKALPFFIHATVMYIALLVDDGKLTLPADIYRAVTALLSDPKSITEDNQEQDPSLDVDEHLAQLIAAGNGYSLGRIGLRPLTSDLATKKYKTATYEAVITLVNDERDIVHVMIVYM